MQCFDVRGVSVQCTRCVLVCVCVCVCVFVYVCLWDGVPVCICVCTVVCTSVWGGGRGRGWIGYGCLVIIIIIYPLTVRVVGASQMILHPVFFIFLCSPRPPGSWRNTEATLELLIVKHVFGTRATATHEELDFVYADFLRRAVAH